LFDKAVKEKVTEIQKAIKPALEVALNEMKRKTFAVVKITCTNLDKEGQEGLEKHLKETETKESEGIQSMHVTNIRTFLIKSLDTVIDEAITFLFLLYAKQLTDLAHGKLKSSTKARPKKGAAAADISPGVSPRKRPKNAMGKATPLVAALDLLEDDQLANVFSYRTLTRNAVQPFVDLKEEKEKDS